MFRALLLGCWYPGGWGGGGGGYANWAAGCAVCMAKRQSAAFLCCHRATLTTLTDAWPGQVDAPRLLLAQSQSHITSHSVGTVTLSLFLF